MILPNLVKPNLQNPVRKFPKTTRNKGKVIFKRSENKVTNEEDLNAQGLSVNRAIDQTFVFQDKVKERMVLNLTEIKDKDDMKEFISKVTPRNRSISTTSSVISPSFHHEEKEGNARARAKDLYISIPK